MNERQRETVRRLLSMRFVRLTDEVEEVLGQPALESQYQQVMVRAATCSNLSEFVKSLKAPESR